MHSASKRFLILSLILLPHCVGCQKEQTIRTYEVARTAPPTEPFPIDQLDHMLVAIVPQDKKAWFFKLVGKKPAIERLKPKFEQFISTVELADSSELTPTWKLPEGWSERGAAEMRAATLLIPDPGGELQLAVSSLPLSIEWEDFLVPNVNRWLDQLQCRDKKKQDILKLAQQIPTAAGESTLFHLAGIMKRRPMGRDPHAGLGIPPANSSPPASIARSPNANSELKYEKPADWQPGRMSSMRKAAFQLPGTPSAGEVVVSSWPLSGQMGDLEFNVDRWGRQELGGEPPTGKALEELTKSVQVDGLDGSYLELFSPAEASQQLAIIVTLVERQGQIWFFKMSGLREAVAGQRENYRDFLGSVRFQ